MRSMVSHKKGVCMCYSWVGVTVTSLLRRNDGRYNRLINNKKDACKFFRLFSFAFAD